MTSDQISGSLSSEYADWLEALKRSIQSARSRAALAVNAELVALYHQIGKDLLQQKQQAWGSKVVDRLAQDLKAAFPDMKGFSARNLKYMRYFAEHCPNGLIGQQPAAQLPWFHIVTLLTKISDTGEREWYAVQAVRQGWSRLTLELNIQNHLRTYAKQTLTSLFRLAVPWYCHRLHASSAQFCVSPNLLQRQGAAVNNFALVLPAPDSALANETLKAPYLFDFLGLADDAHEREIENALVRHITRFLLELGTGFAFVGRQFRLEVAGDEFFIDLLFYHTRLKCYVVIELKATAFKPEHIGQLNFYLSAIDAQIKADDDKPTIGLLLCRKQNRLVAQYAVNGIDKPIGVAEYQLLKDLPAQLAQSLPSIAAIEAELMDELGVDEHA